MRLAVAAGVAALCAVSCGAGPTAASIASAPPVPASVAQVTPYFGSYAMTDNDVVVIARMGWFFDLRAASYRTIYTTSSAGRFTIGGAFARPLPRFADLVFKNRGELRIIESSLTRIGRRVEYRQTDVTISAGGAQLAGTITEPPRPGPHPGIVIVHGAEPGQRHFYDVWVGLYASLGLTVLTYDKRGIGSSTGKYPGEFPTEAALDIYADDASAALHFLARWPGVDPERVGYHGGSQGGWTVPLAMLRHDGAAFAILVSAPATTVDQTDEWAGFTDGGQTAPTETAEQMLQAVRATHSGYDPLPALSVLSEPALWLLGRNDRTVPTAVCVEILDALHKPNFTVELLPTGHGLLVNGTGLLSDDASSPGLAPALVPTITTWLDRVLGISTR